MIEKILTVGGYTLLSRLTGFIRDIILAAIIGAGPVADAFFVAFRLPNHFRAIFAEAVIVLTRPNLDKTVRALARTSTA